MTRGICKTENDRLNLYYKEALRENNIRNNGHKIIRIWEHEVNDDDFSKFKGIF